MSFELITKNLNQPQKEGVETILGPLLVLAGAGSGKTRVLTHRIANIIAQGEAAPHEILAVTFTNKAAREMHERTVKLLNEIGIPVAAPMWISTFHSTCVRILRSHLTILGYTPSWVIYDDNDQEKMLKKVITDLGINEKVYPPAGAKERINKAKSMGLSVSDVAAHPSFIMDDKTLQIYEKYEAEMFKANALDFSDLLSKTHDIFKKFPEVLERYHSQFKFILVDEYQDTNPIQYKLIYQLGHKHQNICAVGDEDQSIYSWRGADIGNIFSFEKDFANCKVIKLEQNYRSTQTIVQAASQLISKNSLRKDKTLFSENEEGHKINLNETNSEYEEAQNIVREVRELCDFHKTRPRDIAIFYRTNAQSRVLEEQLRANSIPYKLVGGIKFYERKEIKDVLCYLRFLLNPQDTISFKRILNVPKRGLGNTTLERLEELGASYAAKSWLEVIEESVRQKLFASGTTKKLSEFVDFIKSMQVLAEQLMPSDLFQELLHKSGYLKELQGEDTLESGFRVENLGEFQNAIVEYEEERGEEASLKDFLEEMALLTDLDKMSGSEDCVTLMTLHISKGLEFPVVFMTGMEDGLFPSIRGDSGFADNLEEERRLAYVGMTRARKRLYLSFAKHRRMWGQEKVNQPSRFLSEIPTHFFSSPPAFLNRQNLRTAEPTRSFKSSYKKKSDFPELVQPMPVYDEYVSDDSPRSTYRKGMKVKHPTYGVGAVVMIEGQGEDEKLSVLFPNHSIKKFVTKFARLEKV